MIQHHTGAVTMVKDLFDTYGAAQDESVFKFASDVNVDQTTEIAAWRRCSPPSRWESPCRDHTSPMTSHDQVSSVQAVARHSGCSP